MRASWQAGNAKGRNLPGVEVWKLVPLMRQHSNWLCCIDEGPGATELVRWRV
jgi:hypothetical protein